MPDQPGEKPKPHAAVPPMMPPHDAAATPAWDDGGMARTSDLLQRSIEARQAERVSVGELLGTLGDRGFGLLIALLTFPPLIPGPPIPGFSLVFAGLIALIGSQLVRGLARPELPDWALRRSFDRARL